MDGASVSVYVKDIPHELYVPYAQLRWSPQETCNRLNTRLLGSRSKCRRTNCQNGCAGTSPGPNPTRPPCYEACHKDRSTDITAISGFDVVERRGFEGYEETTRPFLRMFLTRSYYAKPAKTWLEGKEFDVYECCADAVVSLFVLKNLAGYEWFQFPAGKTIVSFNEIEAVPGPYLGLAPFSTVCFDIETIAEKYNDDDSSKALYPVGVICASSTAYGRTAYVLGDEIEEFVDPYPEGGTTLLHFKDELELLSEFKRRELGPDTDVVSGYDSNRFDLPYVFKRAARLGAKDYDVIPGRGRIAFHHSEKDDAYKVYCPGLVFLDVKRVVEGDTLLHPYDYKLATVAGPDVFDLGAKGDVAYDEIHKTFHGTPKDRGKLVSYCMQDVRLTELVSKRAGAYVEMVATSRVMRVRPRDTMDRGVSFLLTRKVRQYTRGEYLFLSWRETWDAETNEKERVLPKAFHEIEGYAERMHKKKYGGGFVRPPKKALYPEPNVATLDFNSLYPSLVRTYNICRSTQLKNAKQLPADKVWTSPLGFSYAKHREGVYPRIMKEMVLERTAIRVEMAKEKDPDKKAQMNAHQTKVKVVANALYGQMGADVSELVLKSGAASVCAEGARLAKAACDALLANADFVERFGVDVIYGDTDSLMICFSKCETAEETYEALKEVQRFINVDSGLLTGGILKMGAEDVGKMILKDKKKYIKYVHAIDDDGKLKPAKLKIVGISTRGSTPYVNASVRKLVSAVLIDGAPVEPLYRSIIGDVAMGRVDVKMMKHTSKISKALHEYEMQEHVVAARQMVKAGLSVRIGDRVEYYSCRVMGGVKKCDVVVAAPFVHKYRLDWEVYKLETMKALEMFDSFVSPEARDPKGYETIISPKLVAPPVGGPMDAFLGTGRPRTARRPDTTTKRTKSAAKRVKTWDEIYEA